MYMLIRYYLHNILTNMSKNRDVTIYILMMSRYKNILTLQFI